MQYMHPFGARLGLRFALGFGFLLGLVLGFAGFGVGDCLSLGGRFLGVLGRSAGHLGRCCGVLSCCCRTRCGVGGQLGVRGLEGGQTRLGFLRAGDRCKQARFASSHPLLELSYSYANLEFAHAGQPNPTR